MGISHFFFSQFSMLFNGKFAFCLFSILFNGNLRIDSSRVERRTDRRIYGNSPLCPTGHRLFRAAAQKEPTATNGFIDLMPLS